jgi:hypothetical protein
MSAEAKLTAAFEELETGTPTANVTTAKETVDYAKELEEQINALPIEEDKVADEEAEKSEREAVVDEKEEVPTEELQHKLEEQLKVNALLRAKVQKYDGYIKQLIGMVETLGARLKHFGLEHYF